MAHMDQLSATRPIMIGREPLHTGNRWRDVRSICQSDGILVRGDSHMYPSLGKTHIAVELHNRAYSQPAVLRHIVL